jgi:hypothetical protein
MHFFLLSLHTEIKRIEYFNKFGAANIDYDQNPPNRFFFFGIQGRPP